MSSQQIRQDMVDNAVSFLSDSSVTDISLAKKIQFLESKGMTNAEIQHALSLVQNGNSYQSPQSPPNVTGNTGLPLSVPQLPQGVQMNPYQYYAPPPPPAPRTLDWKDYLIMGTTTAGLLYGTYQVVSRYILPKVVPPSKSKLDEDKDAMEREFQRVEAILQKIETDQNQFIDRQEEKSKLIDEALIEVDAIVKATNEKNLRNEETLKYLKLEIDSIKTTLMKNLEAQKSTISSELEQLEKKTDSLTNSIKNISLNQSETVKSSSPVATSSSPTPPPNLLTNSRSTSSVATASGVGQHKLNIPSLSTIPSAKDILGAFKDDSEASTPPVSSEILANEPKASIPAWQLASAHKSNLGSDSNASIPAWQLAAQEK